MSKFKIGDTIRWANPDLKDNQWQNLKIEKIEDGIYCGTDKISGYGGFFDAWDLELVENADERKNTNPFLKTVTETRVFSGERTICGVLDLSITLRNDNALTMRFANGDYVVMDKQSLAELARILNEISEAM